MFLRPEDVDRHFAWSPGRAKRLARRGLLPHHVLADGSVRFLMDEVAATAIARASAAKSAGDGEEVSHD